MVNPLEYANFAAHNDSIEARILAGWSIVKNYERNDLLARVYKKNNEIIVAFATIQDQTDSNNCIIEIFRQYNEISSNYTNVQKFVTDLLEIYNKNQFDISFTGHSNGAIYAEICAIEHESKAVTFESLGSKKLIKQLLPNSKFSVNKIITFLSAPNAINTFDEHVGQNLYKIYIPHVDGVSLTHVAKCIWGTASRILTYSSMGGMTGLATTKSTVPTEQVANLSRTTLNKITEFGFSRLRVDTYTPNSTIFINGVELNHLVEKRVNMQVVQTADWTLKQHKLDNILQAFDTTTHLPKKYYSIVTWPKLKAKFFFSTDTLKETLQEMIPFRAANRGIHTICSENEVIEAQIDAISGYQLHSSPNPSIISIEHKRINTNTTSSVASSSTMFSKKRSIDKAEITTIKESNKRTKTMTPSEFSKNSNTDTEDKDEEYIKRILYSK